MDSKEILESLRSYDPNFDEEKVSRAIEFAMHYHKDQVRESGEPYYYHPLKVADILIDMHLDSSSVITALLHDTVEDTELTLKDIKKNFGEEVAKLVDGVTKLSKIEFVPDHVKQAENFRKLLLAMSADIRVLLVKLADRLHNMRTIHFVQSVEKRTRIALETMEIYAPLAERIGIQKIKLELQEICFSILQPEIRNTIIKRLDTLAVDEDQFVDNVVSEISKTIKDENIDGEVYGRRKSPYSIWMKMQQKNLSLEQLSDIIAFRVVVNTVKECYQVLGIIHTKYKMVPENFQDFISTPKNNSYQSLHTVVIGPSQQKIEIQIRTHYMHEVAELGVAAHWQYKQNYFDISAGTQYRWIRELLAILKHTSDPEEFLQNTKLAMYYDQVFCFTPRGHLIALPKGASTIDFAYAVHSNIGNSCIGAKVNGKIEPLKTILQNGDQVEIIISKTQTPSPTWEKLVITGKARSEIRRFTRSQQKVEYIKLGKSILEKDLKTAKVAEADIPKVLDGACTVFKRAKLEDLYHDVAKGIISSQEIINQLPRKQNRLRSTLSLLRFKKHKSNSSPPPQAVSIKGLIGGIAVHFASCCHPLPGDQIVGIMHTGRGVTVHTKDCNTLHHFAGRADVIIDLIWDDAASQSQHFTCRLKALVVNEPGILAMVAAEIAKENINIINFKMTQRSNDFFEFYIDIEVRNATEVEKIIHDFKAKKSIHTIERVKL